MLSELKTQEHFFASALISMALLLGSVCESRAQMRTWQDSSGSFSVEAELIEEKGGMVKLRKADGSEVTLPLSKLSASDESYIRQQQQPTAAEDPGTTSKAADAFSENNVEDQGEGEPESIIDAYWGGFQDSFRIRVAQGENPKAMQEEIHDFRSFATIVPESAKSRSAMPIMIVVGVILLPFVLIWTLVSEFRANILWGVAQASSLVVGFCFLPLMIPVITLIYVLADFRERWSLGLANLIVIVLLVGSFAMVPLEIYDDIDLTPQPAKVKSK